jgi:hypothetical protein
VEAKATLEAKMKAEVAEPPWWRCEKRCADEKSRAR